jgi:hypothetical protein
MIAKRIVDRLAPEDAAKQCQQNAECHRRDGHDGPCVTFARAMAEKAEQWLRGRLA